MSRSTAVVVAVSLTLLATACAKKAPQPLAPAVAEARASSAADRAQAPAPRDLATSGEQEPDIWSQDLATIDAWARSKGFLGEVYFEYDRYELLVEARERLAKNADFLKQHPQVRVTIEGHCDERGTANYNIALGDRRAFSAVQYLEQLGVDRSRLRVVSFGKEKPQCQDHGEACWSRNRRAAFVITSIGS